MEASTGAEVREESTHRLGWIRHGETPVSQPRLSSQPDQFVDVLSAIVVKTLYLDGLYGLPLFPRSWSSAMSPIVILIRHAQALHNVNNKYLIKLCHRGHTDVSAQNYKIHDPPLSELGVSQCRDLEACLQEHLPVAQKTGLIVVSPMRRTLQTASIGLRWLIDRGTPVQLRGEWQGTMR